MSDQRVHAGDLPDLSGHVAVVTGAGRGIGQAVAAALAAAGCRVVLAGRNGATLATTQHQIEAAGGQALLLQCDVTDSHAVQQLFEQASQQYGPVDILVNNAGMTASLRTSDMDDALWDQIMRVNVTGCFYCCRAAMPTMIERGWGRILNIASVAALYGLAYSAAYTASKHAMLGLTRSLALELGQYGITVNALCPGWVETDMLADAIDNLVAKTGRTPEQARASLLGLNRQAHAIQPADVAAAAMRLLAPAGATTNGEAIRI